MLTGRKLSISARSDRVSFQITVSDLGLRTSKVLCAPFKRGISISPSPLGFQKVSAAGLCSQTFWGLIFLVQQPQAGAPDVGLRPLTPLGEPL